MSETKNTILQVGTSQEGNPTIGSDRVQAPVAGAGSTDFGGSQSHRPSSTGGRTAGPPLLTVEGLPLSRSSSNVSMNSLASVASAKSNASCRSMFSNISQDDFISCKRDRNESQQLRAQELSCVKMMQAELEKMMAACIRQPNVNQTVKDGLKKFEVYLRDAEKKHQEADHVDTRHYRGLDYAAESHKYRKEKRRQLAADTLRQVVLATEKREKRPLSSPEEESRKMRKEQSYAERVKSPPKKNENAKKKAKMKERTTPDQPRASTMLIRVSKGQTYASVLGKLRKEVDPELCQTEVTGARQTKKGDLLLRLGGESNKEAFTKKVTEVVGAMATVQVPEDQRVTLEIRDLDSLTEEQEVVAALEKTLGTAKENRSVKLLKENKRGLKLALVTATRREASTLEALGHVKVGFLSCCVRRRVAVIRCHRCLGFGHKAVQCSGVDRSSACFKCGGVGHTAANCNASMRCFLCSEIQGAACDHVSGSGKCAVFRKALEAAKKEEALKRR